LEAGLGVLNLSCRVANTGVLVSFCFLIFSVSLGTFTLETLNWASEKIDCSFNIHILTKKLVGRWADFFLQMSIIITSLGASVVNIISACQFFIIAYESFVDKSDIDPVGDHATAFKITRLIVSVLVAMTFYLKEMTSLRYISFASLFLLSYLGIVMIMEAPAYIKSDQIDHDYHYVSFTNSWESFYKVNAAFTTYTYAFQNQSNLLPVKDELRNRSFRRTSKIICRAQLATVCFYALIMYVGYFSMGQQSPELIFSRKSIFAADYLMKFGMIFYGLYILTCVPLFILPTKIATNKLLGWSEDNVVHQLVISTSLIMIVVLISVFFSEITLVLNIIAGFFATYMSVTAPGLIFMAAYKRFSKEKKGLLYWSAVFTCTVVTFLGILSTILSIYLVFFPFEKNLTLE
jgi:amino acid permease